MSGPITSTSSSSPLAPAAPASGQPEHYIADDTDVRVTPLSGLPGRFGLFEVMVDGQAVVMDRSQVDRFLAGIHATQPGVAAAAGENRLDAIGRCTVNGTDGISYRQRLAVPLPAHGPEPARLGQGSGTGATEATPWDQRFAQPPTREEQFRSDMALNQGINMLNVVPVVALAIAGRDPRKFLEQTTPLTDALTAIGAAKEAKAAQPTLAAPRAAEVPVPTAQAQFNAATAGSNGGTAPPQSNPGARWDRATPAEAATFRVSVALRCELGASEFSNGQLAHDVGTARSVPATIRSDVVRTQHTHPVSGVARPSQGDLHVYADTRFADSTTHEILGDRWPNARELLRAMGMPLPPADAMKYTVTSGQVRAAGVR